MRTDLSRELEPKVPECGMDAPMPLGLGAQLTKVVSDRLRQVGNAACRCTIVKLGIYPQRASIFTRCDLPEP